MKYIEQAGRSFFTCYREHFHDYKYNNGTSKYTHLSDNKHSIGPISNTMEVLCVMKKGKMMDTLEKSHIYLETKLGQQINDKNGHLKYFVRYYSSKGLTEDILTLTSIHTHTLQPVTTQPSVASLVHQRNGYTTKL